MVIQSRFLIGAAAGLAAGLVLALVAGSGALLARGNGATASNTLVACEPTQQALVRHAVVNGELQVATECVGSGTVTPTAYRETGVIPATYTAAQTVERPRATTAARPVATTTTARAATAKNTRNWQKTALVIGGSTGVGAGIGGLVNGKKGALIGAAIGGGSSAIYEAIKRR